MPLGGAAINTFGAPLGPWLHRSAAIARFAQVDEGGGHYREATVTVAAALPCRIVPAGRRERVLAEQIGVAVTDVGYAAGTADVQRGDTWMVDGVTYRVTHVARPSIPAYMLKALLEYSRPARAGVTGT